MQIVVNMWPVTTMESVAGTSNPRATDFPVAGPTEVDAAIIREENVRSPIDLLSRSLQTPGMSGERDDIGVLRDVHEEVDVLRIGSIGRDRSQQADPLHPMESSGCPGELRCRLEQVRAMAGWFGNPSHRGSLFRSAHMVEQGVANEPLRPGGRGSYRGLSGS